MKPSPNAQAIFDLYETDRRQSIFVDAVAGSGKTTLLKGLCDRMTLDERRKAVFCAFNNHIVAELSAKLPAEVTVKTISSLGFSIVKAYAKPHIVELDNHKYGEITKSYCMDNVPDTSPDGRTPQDVQDVILNLVEKSMLTLSDHKNADAVMALVAHYNLTTEADCWEYVCRAVPAIIERGIQSWKTMKAQNGPQRTIAISFSDMVFLPNAINMTPPPYLMFDNVLVDECQDLNAAQREMVIKMCNPGGRFVFVGDKRQAIYGFAGADTKSVEAIAKRTQAREMPLSVCFRCPQAHVAMAKRIVPQIEPALQSNGADYDAIEGVITDLKYSQYTSAVQKGDRTICRTTAPLVQACFELIHAGKPAKVLGRDIGAEVIKIIDRIEKAYEGNGKKGIKFPVDALPAAINAYEAAEVGRLMRKEHTEMRQQVVKDKCNTLRVVYTKLHQEGGLRSLADIRSCINALFASDEEGKTLPIVLSTVHKAKGLQGDRIFILSPELMPHPMAKQDWEIEQEYNLRYVALTRSTHSMFFVESPPKDGGQESLFDIA